MPMADCLIYTAVRLESGYCTASSPCHASALDAYRQNACMPQEQVMHVQAQTRQLHVVCPWAEGVAVVYTSMMDFLVRLPE